MSKVQYQGYCPEMQKIGNASCERTIKISFLEKRKPYKTLTGLQCSYAQYHDCSFLTRHGCPLTDEYINSSLNAT